MEEKAKQSDQSMAQRKDEESPLTKIRRTSLGDRAQRSSKQLELQKKIEQLQQERQDLDKVEQMGCLKEILQQLAARFKEGSKKVTQFIG